MKRIIVLVFLLLSITLSGCTFEPDFADKAENLGDTLDQFNSEIDRLEEKKTLTQTDQVTIAREISDFHDSIEEFKNAKAPFFLRKIQKVTIKKLNQRSKKLIPIEKRARAGRATKKDLQTIKVQISDDFNINVFNK
jgi:hypothetical protein